MQMRIGIGMAVVVAIGLIWSVAVMSEWVPVVSADAALGTRITDHPTASVIRHTTGSASLGGTIGDGTIH